MRKYNNHPIRSLLTFIFLCVLHSGFKTHVNAQGCSDAGVCTLGPLQQEGPPDSLHILRAGLSAGFGAGEEGVTVGQVMPELEIYVLPYTILQVKVPFVFTSGDLSETSGMGDITLSLSHTLLRKEDWSLHVSAGAKLATGKSDFEDQGRPLPMPYQTGLGTHDLLLGAAWQMGTWHVGLAYQHILSNDNKNRFSHLAWEYDPQAIAYFESNLLDRQDDAVVRVEKSFVFNKFRFTPGVLAIYHTGEDGLTNDTGEQVRISGSDGLTLNITGSLLYRLNGRAAMMLQAGSPAVVRDSRPDGLTRSMVATLKFTYGLLK